jgi:hypothetical protein
MITLYLGLGKGDVGEFKLNNTNELLDFVEKFKAYDRVWLCSGKSPDTEIVITEKIDTILQAIAHDNWNVSTAKNSELHIHEYPSYEDAYKVALDMREGNNKCYN